jgi:hypothetical protein
MPPAVVPKDAGPASGGANNSDGGVAQAGPAARIPVGESPTVLDLRAIAQKKGKQVNVVPVGEEAAVPAHGDAQLVGPFGERSPQRNGTIPLWCRSGQSAQLAIQNPSTLTHSQEHMWQQVINYLCLRLKMGSR